MIPKAVILYWGPDQDPDASDPTHALVIAENGQSMTVNKHELKSVESYGIQYGETARLSRANGELAGWAQYGERA